MSSATRDYINREISFAQGSEVGNQNIRVTYFNLDPMAPEARFPYVYKTLGDGTVRCLNLTPGEGKFLKRVLNDMFPESEEDRPDGQR